MTSKEAAALLGSAKSPRKTAAARQNGQKGGRPRKVSTVELEFLVRQWRTDADGITSGHVQQRASQAAVLRDCAFGLERVLRSAQEGP